MSLPNRLQNINSSKKEPFATEVPVSLEATEEEGQVYLDITKHVAKAIAKYKYIQFKNTLLNALHVNSQYNDEGFQ